MTDAEIMKGVKLCNGDLGNCKECPFDSIGKTCGIELAKAEIGLIERLQAENAALRERLGKAVELPVKVGDTVYFIPTYNRKPIWGVRRGIVQMVGITRQGYHVKIRDRADFNKTYMFRKSAFLSKEQAEARLAELIGEEK